MWKRTDIPKEEKRDLLLKVARHTRSLKVVTYALRTFDAPTSAKMRVFDTDYAENWWEKHRQELVDK